MSSQREETLTLIITDSDGSAETGDLSITVSPLSAAMALRGAGSSAETCGSAAVFDLEDGVLTVTGTEGGKYVYGFEPGSPRTYVREITLVTMDGDGRETEKVITFGSAPAEEPPSEEASLLDLFNDTQRMLDRMDDGAGSGEPNRTGSDAQTPSLADMLVDDAEYWDIVLPGSTVPEAESVRTAAFDASDIRMDSDMDMLVARHEVENV